MHENTDQKLPRQLQAALTSVNQRQSSQTSSSSLPSESPQYIVRLLFELYQKHGAPHDSPPSDPDSGVFFSAWLKTDDVDLQRRILRYAIEKGYPAAETLLRTFGFMSAKSNEAVQIAHSTINILLTQFSTDTIAAAMTFFARFKITFNGKDNAYLDTLFPVNLVEDDDNDKDSDDEDPYITSQNLSKRANNQLKALQKNNMLAYFNALFPALNAENNSHEQNLNNYFITLEQLFNKIDEDASMSKWVIETIVRPLILITIKYGVRFTTAVTKQVIDLSFHVNALMRLKIFLHILKYGNDGLRQFISIVKKNISSNTSVLVVRIFGDEYAVVLNNRLATNDFKSVAGFLEVLDQFVFTVQSFGQIKDAGFSPIPADFVSRLKEVCFNYGLSDINELKEVLRAITGQDRIFRGMDELHNEFLLQLYGHLFAFGFTGSHECLIQFCQTHSHVIPDFERVVLKDTGTEMMVKSVKTTDGQLLSNMGLLSNNKQNSRITADTRAVSADTHASSTDELIIDGFRLTAENENNKKKHSILRYINEDHLSELQKLISVYQQEVANEYTESLRKNCSNIKTLKQAKLYFLRELKNKLESCSTKDLGEIIAGIREHMSRDDKFPGLIPVSGIVSDRLCAFLHGITHQAEQAPSILARARFS